MDLPRNAFKAAIARRERQIGIWCSIPEALTVEMLAGTGYDWMLIDTEHSPIRSEGALPLLQAAAPYPTSCVVRPDWNDTVEIKRMLDIGVQTLLVPYVETVEAAEAAVRAIRYGPAGVRGMAGITRAARFGAVEDYARRAEEEICLLVQIETAAALDNIEAIAAVDGVDGLFIGPADLAASLGFPGEPSHPEVMDAVLDAVRRIEAAGKPAGFLSLDDAALRAVAEAGATFIAVGVDIALLREEALRRRALWPS